MGKPLRDLTGLRFDKLVVIDRAENSRHKMTRCNCRCDCGNAKTILSKHLQAGLISNCGCSHGKRGVDHVQWKGCGEISGSRWAMITSSYNRRRKGRLLPFEIDITYALDLFLKQNRTCALSGMTIYFGLTNTHETTASLDRIDSKMGYIRGNVQWVHKDINLMKNILSQDRFIELCKMTAEHSVSGSCPIDFREGDKADLGMMH